MDRAEKVIVLLPALNEEEAIGTVIDKIPVQVLKNMGFDVEIIVADGGSTDKTPQIANDKKCHYFPCCQRGKGNQVSELLDTIKKPAYLIMLDSDDTYPPGYIVPMVKRLKLGLYDVICGYRVWDKKSMTLLHSIGNWGLTSLANLLYKVKTNDLCTGYWGFNRKALESINITARGFELEANLFSEVNRNHLRFDQIPIRYMSRVGKGHLRFTHGFTIAKKLIAEKCR